MPKIRNLTLKLISTLFFISVSACSLTGEEEEVLVPLDQSTWPTPVPTAVQATPTPFPTVDTAVAEGLLARRNNVPENVKSAQAETAPAEPTAPPLPPTATPEPIPTSAPAQTAAPAASGVVDSFGLNMRDGPGVNFTILRQLKRGDALTVLALDAVSNWLNVQTADEAVGWVNAEYVNLKGDLSQVQRSSSESSSPPVRPAPSGEQPPRNSSPEGRLLIQRHSGGEILTINRDGSGLQHLTTGIDPVLSPDGNRVAFIRWGSGDVGTLWVANLDGSGETAIIGNLKQAKSPSWSPNSQRIALNFQKGGTTEAVQQCRQFSDGEPDINFWQAFNFQVRYDDEGMPVALCWKMPPDPHWQLRVIDLATKTFEDLPAGQYAFAPTWDPANAWRVVSAGRFGLIWTDINRGVAESLTNDSSDRAPIFSADGKYIALTYKQHDHWEVHRLNADGTGRVRLTKTPLYAIVEDTQQWNNASPAFSPTGAEIAFLTDRTGRWEVWVMNLDGSNQRPAFSDAVNDQLEIMYDGNDARALGWGT